jgi:hypothetical protein
MGTALRMSNGFETLLEAMRTAGGALRDAQIPFALAGSVAVYAHGGSDTTHDVDFLVKPVDADRALDVLAGRGFRAEKPPEGWLYKAFDAHGAMIDLIFRPTSGEVDDALLSRAVQVEVYAITLPVLPATDIIAAKLLALKEHYLDYGPILEIVRAVREQIDWEELRERTSRSPYAQPFFTLATELGLDA